MNNLKIANFFVVLIAITILLVSCDRRPRTMWSAYDPDFPINISVFSMAPMRQPPAGNRMFRWIEENLNVTFSWDILVGDKDLRIGVMIAGGDFPDILQIDSSRFLNAGALIPLCGLIERYAPRLKAHYADIWERLKEDDGLIYTLPVWGVTRGIEHENWYGGPAFWIQKEVLRYFGFPRIRTVYEYFDIIRRYKERHPTINGMPTIGFTVLTHDWRSFNLINPPNFLAGFPNDGNVTVCPVTHEVRVFLNQDISKRWFRKLNEMNAIGLVDRAAFVDNFDQYLAKIASGRVLGFHDQMWQFQSAEYSLITQGMRYRTFAPLPIVFDEDIRPWYRHRSVPNFGQGIGISVSARYPERIIRFLDAQLCEEVQKIIGHYGFYGIDYHIDEEGQPFRTQLQRDQQEDEVWILHNEARLWLHHAPKISGSFSNGWPTNIADVHGEREDAMHEVDRVLWEAYGVRNNAKMMDIYPPPNPVW
ncbi:MAG: hypothetical protein FWC97_09820, partial [Treponema sp.]|nr:hypothetical protein [Treponema sp.]